MEKLKQGMQDDLARIRHRDAVAQHDSKADTAIAELEWKMWGFMISSGLILGPIIAVLVIIGIIWIWVV